MNLIKKIGKNFIESIFDLNGCATQVEVPPPTFITVTDSFPDQNGEVSASLLQQSGIELFLSKPDAIGVEDSNKKITFFAEDEEIFSLEYPGTPSIGLISLENVNNQETKVLISLDMSEFFLDPGFDTNYKIKIDEGFFVANENIFNEAFILEFKTV